MADFENRCSHLPILKKIGDSFTIENKSDSGSVILLSPRGELITNINFGDKKTIVVERKTIKINKIYKFIRKIFGLSELYKNIYVIKDSK